MFVADIPQILFVSVMVSPKIMEVNRDKCENKYQLKNYF